MVAFGVLYSEGPEPSRQEMHFLVLIKVGGYVEIEGGPREMNRISSIMAVNPFSWVMAVALGMAVLGIAAPARAAEANEIPAGVHVLLKMQNSITTKTAKKGDYVYLTTATPVVADGRVVIPPGSYVQGVVTRVKRAGRIKGKAQLGISLETVTLANGTVYQMHPRVASVEGSGGGKIIDDENTVEQSPNGPSDYSPVMMTTMGGAMIGTWAGRGSGSTLRGLGIGAGAGAATGLALGLLQRGNDVVLPQGMSVDVVFDRVMGLE